VYYSYALLSYIAMSSIADRKCPECYSSTWNRTGDIGFCYRCENNFIIGDDCNLLSSEGSLHYANLVARECVQVGIETAWKVLNEMNFSMVYVFDSTGIFGDDPNAKYLFPKDAVLETKVTPSGYRYKVLHPGTKDEKVILRHLVAVLSQSSQAILMKALNPIDTYVRMANMTALHCGIDGVYIKANQEPERKQDLTH
jgi:hypothetical protein